MKSQNGAVKTSLPLLEKNRNCGAGSDDTTKTETRKIVQNEIEGVESF